jgi:hypothetical protein
MSTYPTLLLPTCRLMSLQMFTSLASFVCVPFCPYRYLFILSLPLMSLAVLNIDIPCCFHTCPLLSLQMPTYPAPSTYVLCSPYRYLFILLLPLMSLAVLTNIDISCCFHTCPFLSLQTPTYPVSCSTQLNRYTRDEQCYVTSPRPGWVHFEVTLNPRAFQGNFRIRNFDSGVKSRQNLEWPDLIFLTVGIVDEKDELGLRQFHRGRRKVFYFHYLFSRFVLTSLLKDKCKWTPTIELPSKYTICMFNLFLTISILHTIWHIENNIGCIISSIKISPRTGLNCFEVRDVQPCETNPR